MYKCILCGFDITLDDVVVAHPTIGRCVCLRCFSAEVGTSLTMPQPLRRELISMLAGVEGT